MDRARIWFYGVLLFLAVFIGWPVYKTAAPVFWNNRGCDQLETGNLQAALFCFNESLKFDKNHANSWHNKGYTLFRLGRNSDALGCLQQARDLEPDRVLFHLNKGLVLEQMGHPKEALGCLEQVLKMEPQNAQARECKIRILAALKNGGKAACPDPAARVKLPRLQRLPGPTDLGEKPQPRIPAHQARSSAHQARPSAHQARPSAAPAESRPDPAAVQSLLDKGIALGKQKEYAQALELFEQALKQNPRNARAWYLRGLAAEKLGRIKEAWNSYFKALSALLGGKPQLPGGN